jgi:hypothetical protein
MSVFPGKKVRRRAVSDEKTSDKTAANWQAFRHVFSPRLLKNREGAWTM